MRIFLKIIFVFVLVSIGLSLFAYYFWYKPKFKHPQHSFNKPVKISSVEFTRLKSQAAVIKNFAISKQYNSKICFLADMNMPSGANRFFIYDLQKDSIILSGLVAHGSCDNGFQIEPTFSNKINSGCSCLGKFEIGKSYMGRFGLAYKLFGLDSSNSNAYDRTIVLHSYKCVPEQETQPLPICNSRGCPMISPAFLEKLKSYLDKSSKPVLLDIF